MTPPAPDLTVWLLEQIADDENDARRDFGDDDSVGTWLAWVLADCQAKRKIIELHCTLRLAQPAMEFVYDEARDQCSTCGPGDEWEAREHADDYHYPCPTLRLLALPYADRPGYREEWRP